MPSFVDLPHASLAELFDNHIVAQYQTFPATSRKCPCLVGGQRVTFDQLFGKRVSVFGGTGNHQPVQFPLVDQAASSESVNKGFEVFGFRL